MGKPDVDPREWITSDPTVLGGSVVLNTYHLVAPAELAKIGGVDLSEVQSHEVGANEDRLGRVTVGNVERSVGVEA
jgi:hypothetical protein